MATGHTDRLNDGSPAAEKLEQWWAVWDDKSKAHQQRHFMLVLSAIAVGPVAVLFQAIQVIAEPDRAWAAVLTGLEMAALGLALSVPVLKLNRSHDRWLSTRVRAEVFQRELSLLFARVGPYLALTATRAADEVDRRFAVLHGEYEVGSLASLAFTRAPAQWRNALESSPGGRELPDVRNRAARYLQNRVIAQQTWFLEKSHYHEQWSRRLEIAAIVVLALALFVAAVDLIRLLAVGHQPPASNPQQWWEHPLEFVALWLPAVGSAIVGYRSAVGSQRQALSYRYYADAINPLRDALEQLAAEAQERPEDALSFKRLVLDIEEVLSDELQQWWMNMVIKVPHTTA
jgi:hypothetical protein